MSRPVVHCLTNLVTVGRVADALAAAGAAPIMAAAEEEVAAVAARADALFLNCGTPDEARFRALRSAGRAAAEAGVPTVLDPVGCGASEWRTAAIRDLAPLVRPAIVRGGAAEVAALAGVSSDAELRGVGSAGGDEPAVAREAASRLGCVVVAGGAISDGRRESTRPVGAAVLGRVIGAGDVLGALIALAVATARDDPFRAAEAGRARFAAAAERAAAYGPGSFWPAFLDVLSADG